MCDSGDPPGIIVLATESGEKIELVPSPHWPADFGRHKYVIFGRGSTGKAYFADLALKQFRFGAAGLREPGGAEKM